MLVVKKERKNLASLIGDEILKFAEKMMKIFDQIFTEKFKKIQKLLKIQKNSFREQKEQKKVIKTLRIKVRNLKHEN